MTRLYIGSNNATGLLEIETIESIANSFFNGYTLYQAVGVWKGKKENTAILETESDSDIVDMAVIEFKQVLKQDAIGVLSLPDMQFA